MTTVEIASMQKLDSIESNAETNLEFDVEQQINEIEHNTDQLLEQPSEQYCHHIEFEKKATIDMLKYIFNGENEQLKKIRLDIIKINELKEELGDELGNKTNINELEIPESTDVNQKIFKKISISFKILKQLLTILVLRVDDKQYQEIKDNEVKFPKDLEHLSIVVGTFHKAFDREIQEILYEIVDFPHYSDFISMAEVNNLLIPFVADNSIKTDVLIDDFNKFSQLVKDLACEVLNVNTDFEPHIFE